MTFFRFLLLPLCMLISIQLWSQQANNLIFYACSKGDYDVVKLCLQKNIDPNQADKNGVTPLMYASECGNDSVCELLLQHGANPNLKSTKNEVVPALINTVVQNNPRLLDLMLLYGGNPNLLDSINYITPLFYAVKEGYLECAQVLLFHNADPNLVCNYKNPLQLAVFYKDTIMAQLLLDYGANINAMPSDISPLCIAVQQNDYVTASWLINRGADVNQKCSLGTPIFYSAVYADEKMSNLLFANGANINSLDSKGKNAASVSLISGNYSNQKYFESHGGENTKKIQISSVSISYTQEFSKMECRMGFRLGINESRYNSGVYTAISFRPGWIAPIDADGKKLSNNKPNQKLTVFQLGFEKRFSFCHQLIPDVGVYCGCHYSYCLAKLDTNNDNVTKRQIMLTPYIGMYQRFITFGISAGYKFYPMLDLLNSPKHVAEVALVFFFNTNRRGKGLFRV